MAISVKDIQEKIFATQAVNGYDIEEVDDFLDELTEQLSSLLRENLALKGQVTKLTEELATTEANLKDAQSKVPDYNAEGFFNNLQTAMRDSLISAQRIADETTDAAKAEAAKLVSDAKIEAQTTVDNATAEAARVTNEAQIAAAGAKAEYESMKASAEKFRADFRKLIEDQLTILKANDLLFK